MINLLNFLKLNYFNIIILLITDLICPYIMDNFNFNKKIKLIILSISYILKIIYL